jgi:hypothetical protein
MIARGLNTYIDINNQGGQFGIENKGISTDVAETYWDWFKIEAGAKPPIN